MPNKEKHERETDKLLFAYQAALRSCLDVGIDRTVLVTLAITTQSHKHESQQERIYYLQS